MGREGGGGVLRGGEGARGHVSGDSRTDFTTAPIFVIYLQTQESIWGGREGVITVARYRSAETTGETQSSLFSIFFV